MRKGNLTKVEKDFLNRNAGLLDALDLAKRIDRSEEVVIKYLRSIGPLSGPQFAAREDLRKSMAWRQLAAEFNEEELRYFEEKYAALKEQFKDDVFASEEATLFKAIKAEILMHRNLVQQRRAEADIERLEAAKSEALREKSPDHEKLVFLDMSLQGAYASKQARTTEYGKLDGSHQDLMKALKANREQRINKVESSKRSFLDIIRELSEQDAAQRADRQIDQMRKATDKELRRLGALHTYEDGLRDRPLLNSETVMLGDDGSVESGSSVAEEKSES